MNQLVLIAEDNMPPSHWALGRIIALHPGADGHVRVATIRTQCNEVKRAITKLCPLPKSDSESS